MRERMQNLSDVGSTRAPPSIARSAFTLVPVAITLAAALAACTTPAPPASTACVDLTGRYENQSSPPGYKLAPLFFGADDRAETIDVVSRGASEIVVSTEKRTAVLTLERDYVCAADGIRLTKTDSRNIRLPPLLVEKEIFQYVFVKAPDGALRMTEQVESQGKSFGIPMGSGQKQQRSVVRWKPVP